MTTVKRETILSWIEKIALIVILYKMITLIIGGGEQFYETHIHRFVWEGLIYLGIAILIVFRLNLKNIFIYIPTIVFIAVWYMWLLKTGYKVNSPDLWMLYIRKGLALATLIPLAVDAIVKKKFVRFKTLNRVGAILLCAAYIGTMVVPNSMGERAFLLFPIIYLLVSFDKERTEVFLVCFAISNVLAGTVLSLKSLITHPYAGEPRYYGAFTNLHGFGMFVGSSIICCFFLYIYGYTRKWNKWLLIGGITPFLLFELVVFYLINSRNALLGVIVGAVGLGWLIACAAKKKKLFAVTLCSICLLLAIGFGIMIYLGANYDKYISLFENSSQLNYIALKGRATVMGESETGIFPDDSLANHIDLFTNSRLSIWKVTIEQLKWFQGNSTAIVVTEDLTTNTHNTFLGYLNCWGIFVGTIFIAGLVYTLVVAFRRGKAEFGDYDRCGCWALFTIFWYLYSFTIFMNEMQYLTGLYITVCLLLMSLLPAKELREN